MMVLKKSTLALCIGAALATTTSWASTEQLDNKQVYTKKVAQEVRVLIELIGEAALENNTVHNKNYSQNVKSINQQQNTLFAEIQVLDPNAKLLSQTKLLSNFITVSMGGEKVADIKNLSQVRNVVLLNADSRLEAKIQRVTSSNSTMTVSVAAEEEVIEFQAPYLNSETAGEGVSVAIISTGIDYTHTIFGGSGVYGEDNDPETPPTPGSYLEALENGALEYAGFPTDVVVGGYDIVAENYGGDPNPIDQNIYYTNEWSGAVFPTGTGTQIASIIHQLAPGAELYAYKVYNVSPSSWDPETMVTGYPSSSDIASALEHAMDPNGDGDISDHVDIALIDAGGSAAFYNKYEGQGSPDFGIQQMIQNAAAQGMTIITHAGDFGHMSTYGEETDNKHRYWISAQGASPAAITVGSVQDEDGTLVPSPWSPLGPVRGSLDLKPELVDMAVDMPVALISSGGENSGSEKAKRTNADVASARIAAAAAVLKSVRPGLSSVEIKALLANTADHNIKEAVDGAMAELISIGHGIANISAAVNSPIAVWNNASNQPYLQFGFNEVDISKRLVKEITVRNYSDKAQTYQVSQMANGEKTANAAMTWEFPSSVSVPAGQSVTLTVAVTIDGTKLPQWPLVSTEDFTDANWKQVELNGYFTFTAAEQPEVNVGWMLQARNSSSLEKHVETTAAWPRYRASFDEEADWSDVEHLAWARTVYGDDDVDNMKYEALTAEIVNDSQTDTLYETYPIAFRADEIAQDKKNTYGHHIKYAGMGIYDEPLCDSGKKLTTAFSFFRPADVAMANYFDKAGTPLVFWTIYAEQVVIDNEMNVNFAFEPWLSDEQVINQPWVELNEDGQPVTYYIDHTMEYDYNNPTARYKVSKLPARMSTSTKNVVSEVCVDELYHHELDSVEDFDQNFGFVFATDRDAQSPMNQPITQFNPLRKGFYGTRMESVCDWFMNCWEEEITTDLGLHTGFAVLAEGESRDTVNYSHTITLAPQQKATVAALKRAADFMNPVDLELMIISSTDDFAMHAIASLNDSDGAPMADVQPDQAFELNENAEVGTVVGKIALTTSGLFAEFEDSTYTKHKILMVSDNVGAPFAINQETKELYVVNPQALDFEVNKSFVVTLQTQSGNTWGTSTDVMVRLNNLNDTAPQLAADLADVKVSITNDALASINIDLSGTFIDFEGETLSYSATDLPEGVVISENSITGEISTAGEYTITVTASNGLNQASTSFQVLVADNTTTPILKADLADVAAVITNDALASINIDLTGTFTDVEGETLSYSATGLPEGVELSGNSIVGDIATAGEYNITVTASNSVNQASTSFNVMVTDETTTSSGGSFGWMVIGLAGLLFNRRRKA
ncbi:putative Ig domain-containing protein [Colwellia piezophila]|uniref:putative Ig domain-containing protein n=1 Tax=Colwellia piezophila TaxID=211668 RepID=UPI0003A324AE|nr:putative Ig domain-containing protein [Colwellia piezophila]